MSASPSGSQRLGSLAVAASATFFGGAIISGKLLTERDVAVPALLSVRFAGAALMVAAWLALKGRPLSASPRERMPLLVLGGVGYAVEASLFFLAIGHGSAAAVTLVFFVYPVLVAVLASVLGAPLPRALVLVSLGLAVAGAGVVVSSGGGIEIDSLGILFATAAALTYAVYLLGIDRVLLATPSDTAAVWVCAAAATTLGAVTAATGRFATIERQDWWLLVLLSILTAAAFISLFVGIRRIGAVRTSIIGAMEPLSAAVLAAVLLAENLRAATLIGGVLILAGAVGAGVARAGAGRASAGSAAPEGAP